MGRVDFVIGVVGALFLAHGALSTVLCTSRFLFISLLNSMAFPLPFKQEERFTRVFVKCEEIHTME